MFVTIKEPRTFLEITIGKDKKFWNDTIKYEFENPYNSKIMIFIENVLKGANTVDSKWVFRI